MVGYRWALLPPLGTEQLQMATPKAIWWCTQWCAASNWTYSQENVHRIAAYKIYLASNSHSSVLASKQRCLISKWPESLWWPKDFYLPLRGNITHSFPLCNQSRGIYISIALPSVACDIMATSVLWSGYSITWALINISHEEALTCHSIPCLLLMTSLPAKEQLLVNNFSVSPLD